MSIKEFLEPDWRKIVLPAITIIVFLLLTIETYNQLSYFDRQGCEARSYFDMLIEISEGNAVLLDNDTLFLNRTNVTITKEQMDRWEEIFNEAERLSKEHKINPEPFWRFFGTINPFSPYPCEFTTLEYSYLFENVRYLSNCQWFISEKTHGCMFANSEYVTFDEIPEYEGVTPKLLAVNILFLFVEWYLISCFLLWGHGKVLEFIRKGR
jgi:hypothetical protein